MMRPRHGIRSAYAAESARTSGGFTLIETVIAFTILAVGLLTLAAMQLQAMRGGRSGKHMTDAATIAHDQMEQVLRMPWANLAPTAGWVAPAWIPGGAGRVATTVQGATNQEEQVYTVAWRTSDLVANRTRAVDVRVTWNEPNRPNRTYTVTGVAYDAE